MVYIRLSGDSRPGNDEEENDEGGLSLRYIISATIKKKAQPQSSLPEV